MSRKSDLVVGLDNSVAFIRTARELMTQRCMSFSLKQEGRINREIDLELPGEWDCKQVEFIVGDALALPFRANAVASLASLNLVDKVPNPMRHLVEMNRVTRKNGAQFLLSDPFSWSEEVADEQNWLGGKNDGSYSGSGLDNIMALLQAGQNGFLPRWRVETHGQVWWRIRNHANHFEQIRSCYFKASR
jgi:SAM-dependent methyltransferase